MSVYSRWKLEYDTLVVAPQQRDVVRHSQPIDIISIYLFIYFYRKNNHPVTLQDLLTKRPDLWDGRDVRNIENIHKDLALIADDLCH